MCFFFKKPKKAIVLDLPDILKLSPEDLSQASITIKLDLDDSEKYASINAVLKSIAYSYDCKSKKFVLNLSKELHLTGIELYNTIIKSVSDITIENNGNDLSIFDIKESRFRSIIEKVIESVYYAHNEKNTSLDQTHMLTDLVDNIFRDLRIKSLYPEIHKVPIVGLT